MAIKQEVTDLAQKLAGSIKVGKDGTTEVSNNPFIDNLPEGLTEEIVTNVANYNTAFIAGSGLAFGQAAIQAMSENKKLDEASVTFNMVGKDSVSHSVQRSRDSHNPKNGDTITKLGVMTTTHEVRGSVQKVGQLGAVRSEIGRLAIEKLSK